MRDVEDKDWRRAHRRVRVALQGFRDGFTRDACDDLTQDVSLALWQFGRRHAAPEPIYAALPRILQRTRWAAIRRSNRHATLVAERYEDEFGAWPELESCMRIDGLLVPVDWLLDQLQQEVLELSDPSRSVLLSFYGGQSCKQIAERLGSSIDSVKVRIYRTRMRLKRNLEVRARAAGCFDA
jgi:DNA-directed RNA polymerase specialized sigma24 family protein